MLHSGVLKSQAFHRARDMLCRSTREELAVTSRIKKPVDMIDAKPVNLVFNNKALDKPMGLREQVGIFLTDADKIIDIEKAAIIDLIRRHPP